MLGTAIGVAAALSISPPPEKCPPLYRLPGTSPDQPAFVIDGELVVGPQALGDYDLHALEVTCWNPESDEIHAKEGFPFVHVVTTGRVSDALEALESFASAYHAFHAESSIRPESVEQLVPYGLTEPHRFDYSMYDSGVSVSVSDSRDVYRCTSALDRTDDAPTCAVDFTGAKRSLRAAWERAGEEG